MTENEKQPQSSAEFARRLNDVRRRRGITQEALAEEAAVHPNTVRNWERERAWPRADALLLAAKYLGVSVDWLLGLTPHEKVVPSGNVILDCELIRNFKEAKTERQVAKLLIWRPEPFILGALVPERVKVTTPREADDTTKEIYERLVDRFPRLWKRWLKKFRFD